MKRKTVLYCEGNKDGTIGGSYFSLLFLTEALDQSRFRRIVVFQQNHSLIPRYLEAGNEVLVIETTRPSSLYSNSRNRLVYVFRPFLMLVQKILNAYRGLVVPTIRYAKLLVSEKVDLVHLNNSVTRNHPWMFAAILTNTPCITHERGINSFYSKTSRLLAKKLDAIVCISHAVCDCLRYHGVGNNNWHIIYNGLDPAQVKITANVADLRERYLLNNASHVVGIVGNIKEWKGQETVIKAISLIRKKYPSIACLIIGDTSPDDLYYEKRLKKIVVEEGLESNVIFTGYQKNVGNFIQLLDVVIHASVEPEPFGRVLLEAMAMKKPVIGSRAGAVPEIIKENETGLTFTPKKHKELASCIDAILHSPKVAEKMGELGYKRLIENFHIKTNTSKTICLYDDIFRKRSKED